MFSSLGLFDQIRCSSPRCSRINCPFSHNSTTPKPSLPVDQLASLVAPPLPKPVVTPPKPVIGKRSSPPTSSETRPSKLVKTEAGPSPVSPSKAQTATNSKSSGPPILRVNAATSTIPIALRQMMLTNLYQAFVNLYTNFNAKFPHFAHDHAIEQESHIYSKTNKVTYRQAMISSIASLKKRISPDEPSHPSVGTEATLQKAKAVPVSNHPLGEYILKAEDIENLVLTLDMLKKMTYPVEVPANPGGDRPSDEGREQICDRCGKNAVISRNFDPSACLFHWGRLMTTTQTAERKKIFSCCSASYPSSPGCQTGPHVFLEKNIRDLHARHAFTNSSQEERDTMLDIAVIDCEGIYTTQGMSVARVTVIDGRGKMVFDELVRPDDEVTVIDFNTRFSGITSLEKAVLNLNGIRRALDALIGPKTIIIGHSIDSDLSMMRMIHHRLVDTSILYPHQRGLPFRRALRHLAKDHLGRLIQTGDETVGHSSAEDALATLDLVRHYVLEKKKNSSKV